MTLFRPFLDLVAQLWFALDTANAIRHGRPISERARAHTMTDYAPTQTAISAVAA